MFYLNINKKGLGNPGFGEGAKSGSKMGSKNTPENTVREPPEIPPEFTPRNSRVREFPEKPVS